MWCHESTCQQKSGADVLIPGWLRHAHTALDAVEKKGEKPTDPEEARKWQSDLEIENVKLQLANLRTYPVVKETEDAGKLRVVGLYYRMSTANLEIVDPGKPLKIE